MVSGTVDGVKQTPLTKKGRYKTWYRLHPNQDDPNFFGHVMICHNLPAGAYVSLAGDKMSVSEMYFKKGFRETPQELNPTAKLVEKNGEYYLVPEGYELKEMVEKTLFGDGKSYVDATVQRVVKKETVNEDDSLTCDICGKVCRGEFGLKTHKRSHAK